MAIRGPVPQIVNADPDQPGLFRPSNYPVLERPREKLRKNREHMERHGRFKSFKPSGSSTSMRLATISMPTQIDLAKGINKCCPTSSNPEAPPSFQPVTIPSNSPDPRSTTSQPTKSLRKNSPGSSSTRSPRGTRTSAPRQGSATSIE